MATLAVWILTLAAAAGTILALLHLRATDTTSRPPRIAAIAHGSAGAIGLAILLLALRGPPKGAATGVGSFGTTAAILFAGAVLSGLSMLILHRKSVPMAIHAGLAITGYVLLLAWNALG